MKISTAGSSFISGIFRDPGKLRNSLYFNILGALVLLTAAFAVAALIQARLTTITVSVEIKAPADDVYTLYYNAGEGGYPFSPGRRLDKDVEGIREFQEVAFLLPWREYRMIRLDPGSRPAKIVVKKITFKSFFREKTIRPKGIDRIFPRKHQLVRRGINKGRVVYQSLGNDPHLHSRDIRSLFAGLLSEKEIRRLRYLSLAVPFGALLFLILIWSRWVKAGSGRFAPLLNKVREFWVDRDRFAGNNLEDIPRILAFLTVLAALLLRMNGVDEYWINPDEGINLQIINEPTLTRMNEVILGNAHPPLYYYFLKAMAFFGGSIVWLRMLSVVCGTVSVLICYRLGRVLGGPAAALVSSLLLAVSPGAVVLSKVMRPYMVMFPFLLAAILFMVRYWKSRKTKYLWCYSLFSTVALLIHYSAMVALAGLVALTGLTAVLDRYPRRDLRSIIVAHLPLLGAFLFLYLWHIGPKMMGSSLQQMAVSGWLKPYFINGPGDGLLNFLGVLEYCFGSGWEWLAASLMLFGLLAACLEREFLVPGLTVMILLSALAFSATDLYPFGSTRHSIYLMAVLVFPISFTAPYLIRKGWKYALPVLLFLILALNLPTDSIPGLSSLSPRKPVLSEQIIPMSEYKNIEPELLNLKETPGALLLDQQTYQVLAPLFREETSSRRPESRAWGYFFPWGRRMVLVNREWIMVGGKSEIGLPQHLGSFIRDIDNDLQLESLDGDVIVAWAGWGLPLLDSIREVQPFGTEEELTSHENQAVGIGHFRLNTAAYMLALEQITGSGSEAPR